MDNGPNRQVVSIVNVFNVSLGDSEQNVATVALDDRKRFATANETYMALGSGTVTKALRVGALMISVRAGTAPASDGNDPTSQVYTLDPKRPVVDFNGTSSTDDDRLDGQFAGHVDVVVKGTFGTGDKVVYGTPAKAAEISDGMASVRLPIGLMDAPTKFIYVPGGLDELRRGTIAAMAVLSFRAGGNASEDPAQAAAVSTGTISYAGVDVDAYAYGVFKRGGPDVSYLRVHCATSPLTGGCTVFLDCKDMAGKSYFGEAGVIEADATAVWSSTDVAAVLDGGWSSGKGACDLLSNGTLEVQHMIRSGGALVNNSVVIGRSLVRAAELADLRRKLDDICYSVTGHLGRAGNGGGDPDNPNDDISTLEPTPCRSAAAAYVANDVDTNGDAPGF